MQSLSRHETIAVFNIRDGSSVVSHWQRQYDLEGIRALEPRPKGRPPLIEAKKGVSLLIFYSVNLVRHVPIKSG